MRFRFGNRSGVRDADNQELDMGTQQARKRDHVVVILADFTPLDALWSGSKPPYPSEQSARWVVRQYRKALVDGAALALSRGRLLVHPARFAQVIEAEAIQAMRRRDGGHVG